MLIIIKDFVNMHLFVEILRRCMILCVSALYKKIEEKGRKREKGEKKIIYWPYPGWKTFRVDVFRINGLLNKAVRRSRKYSVFFFVTLLMFG